MVPIGPAFGLEMNRFVIYAANGYDPMGGFGALAAQTVTFPEGIDDGEWLRLRLEVNFAANYYNGTGVLSYKNLTDGDALFMPLCSASDLQMSQLMQWWPPDPYAPPPSWYPPCNWTGVWFHVSDTSVMEPPGMHPCPVDNIQIGEADLSISKSDSVDPVSAGGNTTYTVTVANAGPNPAKAVKVVDLLPEGAVFVSASASQGSYGRDGPLITWDAGTVNDADNATLTVTLTMTQSGTVMNRARVYSETTDPNGSNNIVTESTTVQAAATDVNLSVTKSDSVDPLIDSADLTYTIVVNNLGSTMASGVVVTDSIPAVVSYDASGSTAGWFVDEGVAVYNVGSLAGGASTTLVMAVQVTGAFAGLISNAVSVYGTDTESVLSNNTDTETTIVQDEDGDGFPDFADSGSAEPDADGDGDPDATDPDDDNDGMSDFAFNVNSLLSVCLSVCLSV